MQTYLASICVLRCTLHGRRSATQVKPSSLHTSLIFKQLIRGHAMKLRSLLRGRGIENTLAGPSIQVETHDDLSEAFRGSYYPSQATCSRRTAASATSRAGSPPQIFKLCSDALNAIPGTASLSLLEVGCASGYYTEVMIIGSAAIPLYRCGLQRRNDQTRKAILSRVAVLSCGRTRAPFPTAAFEVVLAGAILEHVGDWEKVLSELVRVCHSYLVLHRTVITTKGSTFTQLMEG